MIEVVDEFIEDSVTPAIAQVFDEVYRGLDFDFWKNFCPGLDSYNIRTFRRPGEEGHPQFFRFREADHDQRVVCGPSVFYEDWLIYEPIIEATEEGSKCRKLLDLTYFDRAILQIYQTESYLVWDEDGDHDLYPSPDPVNLEGEWVPSNGDLVPRSSLLGTDNWWEYDEDGDIVPKEY